MKWDEGGLRLEHPWTPKDVHSRDEQIWGTWAAGACVAPESRVGTNREGQRQLPGFQENGDGGCNLSSTFHVTRNKG